MAYSSYIQAKTRVTNPRLDNSGSILYASDNFFTLGTTFYTNESKSVLAPAGNYVIPTNFKTYYATIASNGRFETQPLELMTGSFDTNWTDCTGFSGSERMDLTCSRYDPIGETYFQWCGMKLSLSQSAEGRIYLTDDYWDTTYVRPDAYGGFKAYIIDNGKYHSAGGSGVVGPYGFVSKSLKSLDITDMKGYDLRIINGEYHTGSNKNDNLNATPDTSHGFTLNSVVQGIVHLAADPNRVVTTGSLSYTFRPDYWYSAQDYEAPTYVRRMPDVTHIKDKWGNPKAFTDMSGPTYDITPVSNGQPPYSKNTDWRISTWGKKGITEKGRVSTKKIMDLSLYWYTEPDFDKAHGGVGKFFFGGDFPIRTAMGVARPDIGTSWPGGQEIPAMISSLIVDDFTWANGNYAGYAYTNVNPYHWTTEINSGTAHQGEGPANQLCQYLGKPGGYDNTSANLYLADHIQEDFEVYNGTNDYYVAYALKKCYDSVVAYGIATGQIPNKERFPKWSHYAGGLYNSHKYGQVGQGWFYFGTGSNLNENYSLYKDYDLYYISGSRSALDQFGYSLWRGFGEYVKYSYITNYFNDTNEPWFIYSLVHNYDITRKGINEFYNEATSSTIQACGYLWKRHEPVAGADCYYKRDGTSYNGWLPGTAGNAGSRIYISPAVAQSYAVWCMAYADGMFMWDAAGYGADEDRGADFYWKRYYGWGGQEYDSITGNIGFMYGDTSGIDNGSMDWLYVGYLQVLEHNDIVQANTSWVKPEVYWNNEWKTGKYNYPLYLYNREAPISAYKLSADGTEALIITQHGCNIGYTKTDFTLRLPTKNNKEVLVSTWGNYTSVIRVKNL
jgi:hypothetical protein